MGLQNPQHDSQPQSPTDELCGEKRIEKLLDVIFGDSAAGIRYFQAGISGFFRLPVDRKTP